MENILRPYMEKYRKLNVENRKLIIWGMGATVDFYTNAFEAEKLDIYAYTDSKAEGGTFNGKPVISLKEVSQLESALVILAIYNLKALNEIKEILSETSLDFLYIDEFFIEKNAEIVLRNYDLLADEKSKYIYKEVIRKRLELDFNMKELYEEKHYFNVFPFMVGDSAEVYVDCGAYVGDTMEEFLRLKNGYCEKYYAFEPDDGNYNALCARTERINREWNFKDKIVPIKAGVGEKSEKLYFKDTGDFGAKYTQEKTDKILEIVSLDEYFKNIRISTIKADIESYELSMLKGACEVIKRDRPNMAISIYHNASDLYSIINWVDNLNLGYRFYIRHHSFGKDETVAYIINE